MGELFREDAQYDRLLQIVFKHSMAAVRAALTCWIKYGTSFCRIIISTAVANSHRKSFPVRVTLHARNINAAAFAARSPTGGNG